MIAFEKRIGHEFASTKLLEEALRHASLHGTEKNERSYQRLEYLGDAVLNLCIAEETFHRLPGADEGTLSKARSAVINNRNLVRVGERIGVPSLISTDPSVRKKGGGVTRKMIADAVEAVTGAIFLDGGYDAAKRFVLAHFREVETIGDLVGGFDAKSRLQEWCQKRRIPLPKYALIESSGPAHARTFSVSVALGDGRETSGSGKTKKEAEMEAAAALLSTLPDVEEDS